MISTVDGECSQPARAHSGPVEDVQSHGGAGQAGLHGGGREAGRGLTGVIS